MGFSLFRNTRLVVETLILIAICAVASVCALIFVDGWAALACAAMGVVFIVLFLVFAFLRYREIATLSQEVDEVLHNGRIAAFSDCREGDIAILQNEITKMVAQLRRAGELLANEKTALADDLADISHQMRTPLTAMSLMVSRLERCEDPTLRKELTRQLESMLDRMSWLVTTLLKMARADAGVLSFEKVPVDTAQMIDHALEPLAALLDLHGITVVRTGPSAQFAGDARWTTEALQNILKNCAEHTPDGGTIAIATVDDALALRITVTDTGPGFTDEDLAHLFERFYRGKSKTADDGVPAVGERVSTVGERLSDAADKTLAVANERPLEGFGIGLALAQSLVSAQGGSLRATNAPGGGARFEIAFPKIVV